MTNFFYKSSAFWSYFFFRNHAWKLGCGLYTSAAYTRVFTVLSLDEKINLKQFGNNVQENMAQ